MSAVADSIAEAVSPASIPPDKGKEKKTADVSSTAYSSRSGDKANSKTPYIKVVDTSSSSNDTLVTTPNAGRSSPKEQRRVSISSARPLIATYNLDRPRQLYQYQYGEQDEDRLSDSEDEGERRINEPLLSPYQAANIEQSFESNTTSGSDVHMSTLSSSGPEIFLGPQSVPFPLRKHDVGDAHSTPSRPSAQTFVPTFKNTQPIIIRPGKEQRNRSPLATTVISAASHYELALLSSWRREQIQNTRMAKLMAGTTPRPIPTLHGPLSLPYARNPSGVDATVADESAYLTHVFGLRAAGGTTVSDMGIKGSRRVSSGTHSSGTTSGRSTSGSSGYHNSHKSGNDRSVYTDQSSYTSLRGTVHHSRPLVIRDPYQNIGIKIKGVPPREGPAQIIKLDKVEDDNKENVDPTRPPALRRRASETSLLGPRMGDTVLGPSRSQVNLRDMTNLSPIPGSPAENASRDPFRILHDRAAPNAGLDVPTTARDGPIAQSADLGSDEIQLPDFAPLQYNPETMSYEFAVPLIRSSYEDLHVKTPQGDVTPHTLKDAHNAPSKADTSDNWRKKGKISEAPNKDIKDIEHAVISETAKEKPDVAAGAEGERASAGGVMTIDSLFEKFHTTGEPLNQQDTSQERIVSEASNKGEVRRKTSTKLSRSKAASPQGSSVNVLGESTKKLNVNAPPYSPSKSDRNSATAKKNTRTSPTTSHAKPGSPKFRSTSSKGTPGAGKLLKHAVEGGEDAPSPTVQSRSKGKGKAGNK
ncbi:uncharacterized protein I303_107183 [Kwoniella dejecticola CBS 10117]|uniref:Uncharacterized protein n=1 Tax=Kwoniella dejecticola CBS 10117 TaxID=1296121 RepID=A0A1A5ZZ09_9TREE|nr:uncharacterized protein I303_06584 [Kwoniella dejecticola CBS 10117]OBR83025.1 hypothetical protein I303_06584 [Kwoniella dejecticola CBS 10117]